MYNEYKPVLFSILFFMIVIPLGSCSQSVTAPSGTTITLSTTAKTWDITPTACPSTSYNDTPVTITVKDADGKPMNNVSIDVVLDLSANSGSTPVQVLKLYDGNTQVTSPYSTKTGDFGTKTMIVRMDFGCTYKADLSVYSGTAIATASFETN